MATFEKNSLLRSCDSSGNDIIHYPITTLDCIKDLKDVPVSKKSATFTVGNINSGHSYIDCDYLCDGVDDNIEINQAISNLPENGGKIIILEGVYNLTSNIVLNSVNISIEGMGKSTCFYRNSDVSGTSCFDIFNDFCSISNVSSANSYNGIRLSNCNNCSISNNFIHDNYYGILVNGYSKNNIIFNNFSFNNTYGIRTNENSNYNLVNCNTFYNNEIYGIYINSPFSNISNNFCFDNSDYSIFVSNWSQYTIIGFNHCNTGLHINNSSNTISFGNYDGDS